MQLRTGHTRHDERTAKDPVDAPHGHAHATSERCEW